MARAKSFTSVYVFTCLHMCIETNGLELIQCSNRDLSGPIA